MIQADPATRETPCELPGFMGLVGRHPSMLRVYELIRRVGPSSAPVLITGESGTGKELVARALHAVSPRSADAFVPVHCGAIPEDLLESELFGHVKGAFTGAINARTGRFRLAHGGTIMLDEIGEMSPRFQVKLLRVLEDGSFESVGATTSQRVDVRVLAATHRDLRSRARDGQFRSDLLYRLDVIPIHLPALRDRREDIPLLARHFLRSLAAKGFPHFELAPETGLALMDYDWPGNVRELRNVLERAVLLSDGTDLLQPSDLPAPFGGLARRADDAVARLDDPSPGAWPWNFGPEGTDFYLELESFERRMIGRALQLAGGSKREAARLLQVNRTTLLEKLKRKGWDPMRLGAPAADRAEERASIASPAATPPAAAPAPAAALTESAPLGSGSWAIPSPPSPAGGFYPLGGHGPLEPQPQRAVV